MVAVGKGQFPYECRSSEIYPDAMIYKTEGGGWSHEFEPAIRQAIDAAIAARITQP